MPTQTTTPPFRGRRIAKCLAPLAAASALAFSPLSAQSVFQVNPDDDATALSDQPDNVFGTNERLFIPHSLAQILVFD